MEEIIKKIKENIKERENLIESFKESDLLKYELDKIVRDSEYVGNIKFINIISKYYDVIITNKTNRIIKFKNDFSLYPSGLYYRYRKLSFRQLVFYRNANINKEHILENSSKFNSKLEKEIKNLFKIINFIREKSIIYSFNYVLDNPFEINIDLQKYNMRVINIFELVTSGSGCLISYSHDKHMLFNILLEERRDEIISGFKKRLEKRILLQKKVLEMFEKYFSKEVVIANL